MKYLIWFLRRLFCKHEYKICLYFPEAGNITWKAPCQDCFFNTLVQCEKCGRYKVVEL